MNRDEIDHMTREGTCIACHETLPEGDLATSLLHHVAEYTGQLPVGADAHASLVHKIVLSSAWAQVLGVFGAGVAVGGAVVYRRRRRAREIRQ